MTRVAIVGLGIMGRRMLTHMGLHPRFDPVDVQNTQSLPH